MIDNKLRRILFVCHGNICRSPMAEEIGNPIYPPAKRWLHRIIPDDPQKKVHLLMSYTGRGRDVADPWYTGNFETTFQDILEGCEAMLKLSQ